MIRLKQFPQVLVKHVGTTTSYVASRSRLDINPDTLSVDVTQKSYCCIACALL